MDKIRELLERGLSKERHKAKPEAMEQVSVARWWRSWALDLETNARDALEALSSPHPEAREREEDGLACILAEPFGGWESLSVNELMARLRRAHAAIPLHDARLATPKPEGQALTVEQVGWLRVVLGRALYRVEHFPEQSNDEDIEADELARAIILLGGEPAAPEPRPAEEPNHIPDVTQMVPSEPAPAPSEEAMPEAIAAADMINDAIDQARVSGDGAGLYTRILSIVDEALRSQLARKDEGMREAVRDVIDRAITGYDTCHGKKHYAYTIDGEQAYLIDSNQMAALVRAALREPDGRKGE